MKRIHRAGRFKSIWDLTAADLAELTFEGQLYSYNTNSRLQDDVIDTCFGMGFKSVVISDAIPGGGFSESVIFENCEDLFIAKKLA